MTNEEIKELLRELAAKADAEGEVKSQTVRINFTRPSEPERDDRHGTRKDRDSEAEERHKNTEIPERESSGTDPDLFDEDVTEEEEETDSISEGRAEKRRAERKNAEKAPGFFKRLSGKLQEWQKAKRTRREVEEGLSDTPLDELPERLAKKLRNEGEEEAKSGSGEAGLSDLGSQETIYRDLEEKPLGSETPEDTLPQEKKRSRLFSGALTSARKERRGKKKEKEIEKEQEKKQEEPGEEEPEQTAVLPEEEEAWAGQDEIREEPQENEDTADPAMDEEPADTEEPVTQAEEPEDTGENESSKEEGDPEDTKERRNAPDSAGNVKKPERVRKDRKEEKQKEPRYTEAPDFESDAADFMDSDSAQAEEEEQIRKTKGNVSKGLHRLSASLNGKGIGRRELIMIVCGAVLLFLIIFVVLNILNTRKKSANVTADEGLHVSVEREPSSWSRSGSVTLKIRSDSPIQTVTVNEVPTEISGETRTTQITLDAVTDHLDVMVVTEENVKNASVELKKIDTEDPQIMVSSEDGKIILDVTDNKSGAAGVWYGVKEPTVEVAAYMPYTEPFEPEPDKIYAYFAKDNAGNVTEPVITNLTPAKALVLDEEQISLFPGETYSLKVKTEPENAFMNGLVMESSDPSIATVDERGVITALSDGEADITVSAQELNSVSCHILARSEVSFTISALGDITLGEDVNFSPLNSFSTVQTMYGNSYFFTNVRDILAADDVTFGNFEGTLTQANTRAEKQYAFRGDPSYAQILTDGSIEVVTLANNHSSDYGPDSLTDTQHYLDEEGIEWCSGDKIVVKDFNGVKVGLIGIYVLDIGEERAKQVEETIAAAKDQGAQLIVVAFHWGTERETKPDKTQTSLAHLAIDCGADLVVGHHPHVLQGIEKYSGKYICYSLANFCFGGNSNPSDKDTMIFQQTFSVERGGEIRGGEATVIPCLVSSEDGWNNYQPTPAEGETRERILEKINELCEPFGTAFQ